MAPGMTDDQPGPAVGPRRALARVLRWLALTVVAVFAVAFVADRWQEILEAFARLRWEAIATSAAFVVLGLLASVCSWRAVLGGLGSTLPVLASGRVYFLGQLGKYVPGSVWPVLAQAELSKEYGVPRARSASAALTNLLVSAVVGTVVAAGALASSSADALRTYWWLLPVGAAGAVVLVPAVFNRILALAFRMMRRPAPQPLRGRPLARSMAWSLVMWAAFGAHLWTLCAGIGITLSASTWLLATGAYALAWVTGFVVVVLPAGAGAREAALTLALASVLSPADALMLALVSRVLMLAGDFGLAGAAVLAARRRRSRIMPAD